MVVPTASGADVTNRLARDLVGVVVKLPGQPARYFPRLADGATLHYADGAALPPRVGTGSSVAGKLSWQSELRSESFPKQMARDTDGAPVAWKALDDSVPSLDWWPDDVPVVLAQLDGGEGKTSGGRHPVSPWGKPEGRTRDKTKPSQKLIVRRRRTRGSRR